MLSVVKHDYVPLGVSAHPRFNPVVVADDASQPDTVHERNKKLAVDLGIPYVRDVEQAIVDYDVQVAVVSSQAERHCDLSVRAANHGLHVVQDKPMSTNVSECDRVVEAIERNGVKFMMWNRNFLPAVLHSRDIVASGAIGVPQAIHVDFYFASDQGPRKGTRNPNDPPIDWEAYQMSVHPSGKDGGVGVEPMGELKIEGIYPLAYIRMLTGVDVQRVFARTTAHFHQLHVDNDVEDLATVTLEMEHGIVGSLCIGRTGQATHPSGGEIKIHILGSQGGLVVNEGNPTIAMYYHDQPTNESRQIKINSSYDFLLMENFAQAIDLDNDTVLDARAGRSIAATVQAAVDSGQSGKPVEVL